MVLREQPKEAMLRWAAVELLQEEYAEFPVFLNDAMHHLGFRTSPVQVDIGNFISGGPHYLMVQAQRGQAKTTITAIYAVWELIHNPSYRILIISAGGTQANEISTLIVRLIMTMDGLDCLRPDKAAGDRTSVEAFDVHHTLKGIDKSPSVACVGITGNLQGKRADILIADDVESKKNARTPVMREILLDLTRDFTSMCETGRIIYLGTPQTMDSVYNTLPGRGFAVRIWPGRYPTAEQMEHYGDMLAPLIRLRLKQNPGLASGGGMLGDQGQPTDPTYLTEEILQAKELDQGPAYFQLQHMLNTALTDALRYPLKPENLVVMKLGQAEYYPVTVVRGMSETSLRAYSSGTVSFKMTSPHVFRDADANDTSVAKLQGRVMYIDPAGGGKNADETGYAVTGFLNSTVYWLAAGGVPGGYNIAQMEELARIAKLWDVDVVKIEKNMGYGAFREVFSPILMKEHPRCGVEDDLVTGQKELRIIETLEPVMARGSLVCNESIVEQDQECCERYGLHERSVYSVFHQMSKITRDRGALVHDDRLDALEGAVRHWVAALAIDQQKAVERAKQREWAERMKDPFNREKHIMPRVGRGSLLDKYRR